MDRKTQIREGGRPRRSVTRTIGLPRPEGMTRIRPRHYRSFAAASGILGEGTGCWLSLVLVLPEW